MIDSPNDEIAYGRAILQRARVAADEFESFDRQQVEEIVRAVADAAYSQSEILASRAVAETGFGVVEDKIAKNKALSKRFVEDYADADYCSHRIDRDAKMILTPRPAGVVLALTPSTSPVAGLYFKVLAALLTRNAVVISPHPAAAETSVSAVETLAAAAVRAGAPEHVVQILPRPSVPLVEAMMADPRVGLIVATGGSAMVKAAYKSGNPAIGVGPGNPPVLVDETADLRKAADDIVSSKTYDNSVLCTAESMLVVVQSIKAKLLDLLVAAGAHLCTPDETDKIRNYMYPNGKFNTKVVGRSAHTIAEKAGIRTSAQTRLLLTPIERVEDSEPLTHEKLSPVLAVHTVSDFTEGLRAAQALVDIVGIGHSAVIHSTDRQRILDFAVTMPVHRMTVNNAGSTGNAGIGTTLPMTMSVGTGFSGGSCSGDNLTPNHLIQWKRMAWSDSSATLFPDFSGLTPTRSAAGGGGRGTESDRLGSIDRELLRTELRRIVLEEFQALMGSTR